MCLLEFLDNVSVVEEKWYQWDETSEKSSTYKFLDDLGHIFDFDHVLALLILYRLELSTDYLVYERIECNTIFFAKKRFFDHTFFMVRNLFVRDKHSSFCKTKKKKIQEGCSKLSS